jgi:hypothetical protein
MMVAFFKGPGFVSRLIKIWTRSKYSHCELVFDDGRRFSADTEMPMHTRFSTEAMTSKNWDFVHIPMSQADENKIKGFCFEEIGCRYDWTGIFLSQFIRLGYQSKTKWFCSEVCVAGLQQIGLLPGIKPNRVSPGKLFKLINK